MSKGRSSCAVGGCTEKPEMKVNYGGSTERVCPRCHKDITAPPFPDSKDYTVAGGRPALPEEDPIE